MAKFRSNHRSQARGFLSGYLKILIALGIVVAILLLSKSSLDSWIGQLYDRQDSTATSSSSTFYLPGPQNDPIYQYKGFTLAYNEKTEQPSWVAYELNIDHLNGPKVSRTDYFKEDLNIKTGSATYYDYKNSGYTKGHLVPAADRAYSLKTMEETFLLSNISPQTYACNGGIWRELEEQTRDWARENRSLYIVSGPLFSKANLTYIGANQVAVPQAFFKVILDHLAPEVRAIAFVIPNDVSDRPLQKYVHSIDEVEEKTGLDFFYELFTDNLEDSIEQQVDLEKWTFDYKRYQTRVNNWNNR
ncbi:MAG: DNA/RNA non-specific endonuclease [Saprospiraceae bacterium]|nr:DNA/RNA non-specific endonuclease [Saprospiraceae bacterium]